MRGSLAALLRRILLGGWRRSVATGGGWPTSTGSTATWKWVRRKYLGRAARSGEAHSSGSVSYDLRICGEHWHHCRSFLRNSLRGLHRKQRQLAMCSILPRPTIRDAVQQALDCCAWRAHVPRPAVARSGPSIQATHSIPHGPVACATCCPGRRAPPRPRYRRPL